MTAATGCVPFGGLVPTGPNLLHEGAGDVAGGDLMAARTLTLGLHETEPNVAHTCPQAGFANVSHLNPRVFAATRVPPARVRSLHRSGALFAAAA